MPSSPPLSTTRQAVKEYTDKGLTPREIAQILGISTQRVYVHLERLKRPVPTNNKRADTP